MIVIAVAEYTNCWLAEVAYIGVPIDGASANLKKSP